MNILVINPGSTSTKLSIYVDDKEMEDDTLEHDSVVLNEFERIPEQYEFRMGEIKEWLRQRHYTPSYFHVIAARGGSMKPVEGGVYRVNEAMLRDLRSCRYGEHASNLAALIAHELGARFKIPAVVADPIVTDEFLPVSRLSGHPLIPRKSIFHALNQKAVARRVAEEMGQAYEDCNFVVAHMGGGISVAAHRQGRVVDSNNGLDGEGPYTPERSGTMPRGQLIDLCFSGQYSQQEIKRMMKGQGGLTAYLNTNDVREVEGQTQAGDEKARFYLEGMAYQVSKEIGAYGAVLAGQVDCIILTGGIAYSAFVTEYITRQVSYLAPVRIVPGSDENRALAQAARRAIEGRVEMKEYK